MTRSPPIPSSITRSASTQESYARSLYIMPDNKISFYLAGLRVALDVAEQAANLSQVPLVQVIIGAASTLLGVIETTRTNREDCEYIAVRAVDLVTTIATSLSGKDEKYMDQSLKAQLASLNSTLTNINEKLTNIAARNRFRRLLTSRADSKEIQGCKEDILSAIQKFQVQFNITQSVLGVARHNEVMSGFKMMTVASPIPQEPFVFSEPPATPAIFYGRGAYVAIAVSIILTKLPARLAILGSGGIGKTSVAVAILHDPKVKDYFGSARCFVSCDSASNPELLLNVLVRVFKVQKSKGVLLEHLLGYLQSAGPLLLVLDNFETPWDGENREKVEELLSHLASVDTLTLLITMRGTVYPMGVRWTQPILEPLGVLEPTAAKMTYLDICSVDDPSLDTLLKEIDYIPLAVTLIAKIAQSEQANPTEMLEKWKKHHTAFLRTSTTSRLSNVDMSISLSIQNKLVQENPETMQLLAVVCTLPDGVFQNQWPEISSFFRDGDLCAQTLRQTALAYKDRIKELQVLSPIRHYVQKHHGLSHELQEQLTQLYFSFAAHGENYEPGNTDMGWLLTEESGNITSMLLESSPSYNAENTIEAVVSFSQYLYWTYPSVDLIVHIQQYVTEATPTKLKAKLSYKLGEIQLTLRQYKEAYTQLQEAKHIFESLQDKEGVAQCQKVLGEITRLMYQFDTASALVYEAKLQFDNLGDKRAVAWCLRGLASIAYQLCQYDEASTHLQEARLLFEAVQNKHGIARCQQSLGDIACLLCNSHEASTLLQDAKLQFDALQDKLSAAQCQQRLGEVARNLGHYDEAFILVTEAKLQFESMGNKYEVAWCHLSLGRIALEGCHCDEASRLVKEAKLQFDIVGDKVGGAQCQHTLGRIAHVLHHYDDASKMVQQANLLFDSVGNKRGVAQCQQTLGEIAYSLDHYDEAFTLVQEAKVQFHTLGDKHGAAMCSQILGNFAHRGNQYDEASTLLHEAKLQFEADGHQVEADKCQKSLDEITNIE